MDTVPQQIGTVCKVVANPARSGAPPYGFIEVPGRREKLYFNMYGGHCIRYLQNRDTIEIFHSRPCLPAVGQTIVFEERREGSRTSAFTWYLQTDFDQVMMHRELCLPVIKKAGKPPLTLAQARALLANCKRHVLDDKAFHDKEVTWRYFGRDVAVGYFGQRTGVSLDETATYAATSFDGRDLEHVGLRGTYDRNDDGGSDPDISSADLCRDSFDELDNYY